MLTPDYTLRQMYACIHAVITTIKSPTYPLFQLQLHYTQMWTAGVLLII